LNNLQCPLPLDPRPALTKQSFNDKLCLTLFFQDLLTSSAKYRYLNKIISHENFKRSSHTFVENNDIFHITASFD